MIEYLMVKKKMGRGEGKIPYVYYSRGISRCSAHTERSAIKRTRRVFARETEITPTPCAQESREFLFFPSHACEDFLVLK